MKYLGGAEGVSDYLQIEICAYSWRQIQCSFGGPLCPANKHPLLVPLYFDMYIHICISIDAEIVDAIDLSFQWLMCAIINKF